MARPSLGRSLRTNEKGEQMATKATPLPILRTSERAAFKRCVQKWYWEYRMGYRPRGNQADALWFGIGVHIALAVWYDRGKRRGVHPAKTFAEWAGEEVAYAKTYLDDSYDAPVWEDATELGIAMLEAYVNNYGRDSQWDIISVEQPFSIRIVREGEPVALFRSRWDGVFRDLSDGRIYLLENKTASQIVLSYLALDDQAGSYWAVASHFLRAKGVLKPGEEIAGIMYNFLRKTKPDNRERNADGHYLNLDGQVSKRQPPPAFVREVIERSPAEQRTQLNRIADEVAAMNLVRQGILPVTKTPTKDCPWCPFFVPCQLHERGNKSFKSVMRADFIQIDPYDDDAKSANGAA